MNKEQLGILIVAPEEKQRMLYKNIFNWESKNCYIASYAESDKEAIEKIKLFKPALVLCSTSVSSTDSGFNISKKIKSDHKNFNASSSFIFMTEEKSFEVAQKAFDCEASAIISLPPAQNASLTINRVIERYRQNNRDLLNISSAAEEQKSESLQQMFIFNKLIDTTYREELEDCYYQVVLISPRLCGFAHKLRELRGIISKCLTSVQYYQMSLEPLYAIVFINQDESTVKDCIKKLYDTLHDRIRGCFAVIGSREYGLDGVLESYKKSHDIFGHVFNFTDRIFITLNDITPNSVTGLKTINEIKNEQIQDFMTQVTSVVQYVEVYDVNKIVLFMEERQKIIKEQNYDIEVIRKLGIAFVIQLKDSIHTKHPEKSFEPLDTLDFVTKVYSEYYYDDIMSIVTDFTKKLAASFASVADNSKILKIVQYVRENYTQDLKLEGLASLFNCNSAYLGKKFHDFTGISFNTFVDELRINKAKEYLKTDEYRIYEISSMLGYTNADYFYLKFKKNTGMTPKEYQKSLNLASVSQN